MTDQINNHVEEALARLQEKYKNKDNIINFITPIIEQIQDLENMFFDVKDERSIAVAEGEQLDGIGQILNQDRGGLNDATYRALLYSKIAEYNSSGLIEDILSVIKSIMGGTIEIKEYFPATIAIVINNPVPIVSDIYVKLIIEKAIAAGVGLDSIVYAADDSFRFDTTGFGFDEGKFAKTI